MLNFEIKTRQKDFCPNVTFCEKDEDWEDNNMGNKKMKIPPFHDITTWETKR